MEKGNKKILFVCIHNTCRSVIAEAIFNSIAKEWRANSAGIKKADRVDETAVRLLKENGYEVNKEKTKSIDEVNLEDYGLVITVCKESCPFIPFRNVRQWRIEDPAGKDVDVYRRVIEEIKEKVKKLVNELESQK